MCENFWVVKLSRGSLDTTSPFIVLGKTSKVNGRAENSAGDDPRPPHQPEVVPLVPPPVGRQAGAQIEHGSLSGGESVDGAEVALMDVARNTQFGFVYGPVQVVRMFDDKRGVMLGLADATAEPHKVHTQIWVSAKWKRIHVSGKRVNHVR